MGKITGLAVTLLFTCINGYAQQKEVPVIIIMADQLRQDAIGQYTPNINALKKDGVTFNRTYTACPLCAPSRGAFFTGRYPNNSGSLINGWTPEDEHYRNVKSGTPNLYQVMAAGWDAWHVGKQHFFTQDKIDEDPNVKVKWITQKDYKEWLKPMGVKSPGGREFTGFSPEMVSGKYTHIKRYTIPVSKEYKQGLKYFPDDYFGEKSAEIIRNHNGNKPLMLATMFLSPHPPFDIPAPYFSKIRQQDLKIPANVGQWYKDQSPLQLYALGGFIGSRYSRQDWEKLWPKYMGLVNLLDDETGKIIRALKEKGLYDKALIIFTADHGEMLGSHSLWMKMCMYEESVRVPLIIKFPSDFHPAIKETGETVSLTDVWPTLMDFLRINKTGKTDGISLMPLLNGKTLNRERIFIQYDGNAAYASNQRCVVEGNYKLIIDTFKDEVYLELYNVAKDPQETTNLAPDPAYKAVAEKLIVEIRKYMRDTNDLLTFPEDAYRHYISNYAALNQKAGAEN